MEHDHTQECHENDQPDPVIKQRLTRNFGG